MTKQPSAMDTIRFIIKELEREKSRLYRAYDKRIFYTIRIEETKNDRQAEKLSASIDAEDELIHLLKEYIADLINDLKYAISQYDTEIDTKVREYRKTLDQL